MNMKRSALFMMMLAMMLEGGYRSDSATKAKIESLVEQFVKVVPVGKQEYWMNRVRQVKSSDKKIEILESCIKHFGGGQKEEPEATA